MITVYGWRPGADGSIEIKTTMVNTEEAALNWMRHCKMPCKDYATNSAENNAIRKRLWNHD